ncbi:uncharacterized protein BDZ99DRAFT_554821 [Mytilinidion resinicola]|uniref:Uncharacterized protein n=1 Tax=Mytilinidion resinicola TaxID=574789 RepID=A0A6A6Z0W5_9PEZI|nr:uncharacterized protein BDZ99DRAFT_554821 [Mytilinidion resinicola]KAF2814343.1 hypothetical protein BDZ99DRAFT_554821 [Mytilinidion resinicola]
MYPFGPLRSFAAPSGRLLDGQGSSYPAPSSTANSTGVITPKIYPFGPPGPLSLSFSDTSGPPNAPLASSPWMGVLRTLPSHKMKLTRFRGTWEGNMGTLVQSRDSITEDILPTRVMQDRTWSTQQGRLILGRGSSDETRGCELRQ